MSAMIVPRGCHSDYYAFLSMTAAANGDQLVIDRRLAERRHRLKTRVDNRRCSERRGPPPATWERDGLIMIPHPAG
jgi:hypothetical protein